MPLSRGASILDIMSSKYSLSPLKYNLVRAGRTTRVSGDGCRFSRSARDRGDRDPRPSDLSLVNEDRLATIASGEMYPEWGILWRERLTRSVVDKSSFPNPGNGMPVNQITRKCGADPPRNEWGSTDALLSSEKRYRVVRAGNGLVPTDVVSNEFGTPWIKIPHTRFCCLSAVMRLVTPGAFPTEYVA